MKNSACPPFSAKTMDSKNGGHGAKRAFAHPTDWRRRKADIWQVSYVRQVPTTDSLDTYPAHLHML
jgi:hypothetical protein